MIYKKIQISLFLIFISHHHHSPHTTQINMFDLGIYHLLWGNRPTPFRRAAKTAVSTHSEEAESQQPEDISCSCGSVHNGNPPRRQ